MKYLAILLLITIPAVSLANIPIEPTQEQVKARSYHYEKPKLDPSMEQQISRYVAAAGINPYIMLAISKCESNFNPKAISKTSDFGLFQVNIPAHGKEVKRLGLNLLDPIDNISFAIHLFKREGTRPWKASAHCWQPKLSYLGLLDT